MVAAERHTEQRGQRVTRQLAVEHAGHAEAAPEHEEQREPAHDRRLRHVQGHEFPRLERHAQQIVAPQRDERERQRERADPQVLGVHRPAHDVLGEWPGQRGEQQRDGGAGHEPERERGGRHAHARGAVRLLVEEARQRAVHAEHEHQQHARRVARDQIGDAVLLPEQHACQHRHQEQVHGAAAHLSQSVDERLPRQALERLAQAHRAPIS